MTVHRDSDSELIPSRLVDSPALVEPLLKSMPSAAMVVNPDHRVILVNDVLVAAAGAAKGSLIGLRPGEIFRCKERLVTKCDECTEYVGLCKITDRVITSGKPEHTQAELKIGERTTEAMVRATPFPFDGATHALVIVDERPRAQSMYAGQPPAGLYGIVGQHPKMLELFDTIQRVARLNLPVLIQGESGTGKEMVAVALHEQSGRSGPLVSVNSGALPEGVLESELFGHVRGSFTGAVRDKRGRFEIADHGTLFLDEIGEISPAMQVKLLRALQEGTFERVGAERTQKVDVRVICATNRNVESDVATGRFRADLFYRISVVPITVPPLRVRKSDIPLLARYFLQRAAAAADVPAPDVLPETLEFLMRYSWPGNVRELDNALHFALLNADGGLLRVEHLPPRIRGEVTQQPSGSSPKKLDSLQVNAALRATGGNKLRAAQLLGVSRATLYRFLGEGDDTVTH